MRVLGRTFFRFLPLVLWVASSWGLAASSHMTVRQGDNLTLIAQRYHLTVAQLRRWNNLEGDFLRQGQRLRIAAPPPSWPVRFSKGPVLGIPVMVVKVNLANPRVQVRPLLPPPGLGRGGEQLKRLAWRTDLVAAVNGGYFHPKTFAPAGDLVVGGKHLARGHIRTALTITPDKKVQIYAGPVPVSWRGYETVIANGPYVLRKGRLLINPRMEGYRDPAIWSHARRSAVGILGDQQLVFVSTAQEITLSELAKVMAKLGAKEALVLDGGSSTGMVWQSQVMIRPARSLAYGIGIFVSPPKKNKS